jgi:hypothetical protein
MRASLVATCKLAGVNPAHYTAAMPAPSSTAIRIQSLVPRRFEPPSSVAA